MAKDDRINRLAQQIEARASRDERLHLNDEEAALLRRRGAAELYSLCAGFVDSVNRLLTQAYLELAPPEYDAGSFREPGANLFQVSSQGRILQFSFEATPTAYSTEKFLIPYTLDGELRIFNQEMLERVEVQTTALFYCLEPHGQAWRHYDWRTNRSGLVDRDFLVSAMERLL
jgi:hypothetical protein